MARKTPKLHPVQRAYAKAKAAYSAAERESIRQHEKINHIEDHGAWADLSVEIDAALHKPELMLALVDAENALLTWGHNQIKTHPLYASKRADMEMVFTKGARHFRIRREIIDLCFRLEAR
jgi:hypothetical protein